MKPSTAAKLRDALTLINEALQDKTIPTYQATEIGQAYNVIARYCGNPQENAGGQ